MDKVVKQCLKCKQVIGCCKPEDFVHIANNCNGELKALNISWDELSVIEDISTDKNFLQAMIDLKENDIILTGSKYRRNHAGCCLITESQDTGL